MADQQIITSEKGGKFKTIRPETDLSSVVYGRVMPQAVPLEEAVIGAILVDKDGLPSVIEILRPESFYKDVHGEIYEVMLTLFEKSQPIDLLTVHEALKKSGKLESIGGLDLPLRID